MSERGDYSDSVTRIVEMDDALRVTNVEDPVTQIVQVSIELWSGRWQGRVVAVAQASVIDHSTHTILSPYWYWRPAL